MAIELNTKGALLAWAILGRGRGLLNQTLPVVTLIAVGGALGLFAAHQIAYAGLWILPIGLAVLTAIIVLVPRESPL